MVNLAGPINARQLEVLRWIADGCPHGVMKDYTYKTTAIALQGRRLVNVTRKGGGWQAELTDAGGHYLRHAAYPDGFWTTSSKTPAAADLAVAPPATVADRHRSAAAQSAGRSRKPAIDLQPQHLVARVIAADGILEVDTEDDETDYERLITASKHAPNLPFGKQLRLRTVGPYGSDRCEVYLDEDFSVTVAPRPVPVPQRVAAWHPAVAAYRADLDRQEVSKDSRARASHILQALANEAARRGYTVVSAGRSQPQYNSDFRGSLKDGQIRIGIDAFTYQIRLRELGRPGGASLPFTAHRTLPRWQAVRHAEFVPTGILQLTIGSGYRRDSRPAEFKDTRRASLEDQLPALLRELEVRAREDAHQRLQEERQAEQKRRRWERAMEQARNDFHEASRIEELTRQMEAWRLANDLDHYLSAMRESIATITDKNDRAAAENWLAWAGQYRKTIDPLGNSLEMPPERTPSRGDLRPFLRGWSPYGPDS